ncbi:GNAT family N-acetyltransferase [Jeotgalibaca dankookensis]|uniref:GNAT family N-acetyltransferase n=1 Tax=Jeotgalibaca dankookensis TaxID=708126 RepID=UPI0007805D06|nr:GNAT family N-acetyltransferase [Jeotgalibaca dankookensis]
MLTFELSTDIESTIYQDALALRHSVFVDEQNVSLAIEIDEKESSCIHVVGYDQRKRPLVTARLYPLNAQTFKLQRVAVLLRERGNNYGKEIMAFMEAKAKQLGATEMVLGAQVHALPFYEKLDYQICSEQYEEAGIFHYDMKKVL